ncbi:unnamed protein product [Amoebophrya sp. A25]|nr:unnamed protein product [Amoebophrya sp. A25]|eukprot:GSA25T00001831001.1
MSARNAEQWSRDCEKFAADLNALKSSKAPEPQKRQRLATTLRHLERQLYQHSEQPAAYQLSRPELQRRGELIFHLQSELEALQSPRSRGGGSVGALRNGGCEQVGGSSSSSNSTAGPGGGTSDLGQYLRNTTEFLLGGGASSSSTGGGTGSPSKEFEMRDPTLAGGRSNNSSPGAGGGPPRRDIEEGPVSPPMHHRGQQQMFREQDQGLDMLAGTVSNLKHIGGEIYNEVQHQDGLLDSLGNEMDDSQNKIKSTAQLIREIDKDGSLCFWWGLIIVLFVLNVIVAVFL